MLKIMRKIVDRYYLRSIRKRHITIISNNCWGSFKYQQLHMPYNSPFVGLFLFAPDYIKMLQKFSYYIDCELTFSDTSKYIDVANYPIGLLDDVEIHFLHYKSVEEAKEKWDRRVKRIDFNDMYFKFSDRDLCNDTLLKQFDELPFKNKVCFTAKNYPQLDCCVWLKEQQDKECVENEYKIDGKYFDLIRWLK